MNLLVDLRGLTDFEVQLFRDLIFDRGLVFGDEEPPKEFAPDVMDYAAGFAVAFTYKLDEALKEGRKGLIVLTFVPDDTQPDLTLKLLSEAWDVINVMTASFRGILGYKKLSVVLEKIGEQLKSEILARSETSATAQALLEGRKATFDKKALGRSMTLSVKAVRRRGRRAAKGRFDTP